jgi:hypothetical protein
MKIPYFTVVRALTNTSTALAALAGGLGTLPIDSANLPLPPDWRPYLQGVALIAIAIRVAIIPTLDAIAKGITEIAVSQPDNAKPK